MRKWWTQAGNRSQSSSPWFTARLGCRWGSPRVIGCAQVPVLARDTLTCPRAPPTRLWFPVWAHSSPNSLPCRCSAHPSPSGLIHVALCGPSTPFGRSLGFLCVRAPPCMGQGGRGAPHRRGPFSQLGGLGAGEQAAAGLPAWEVRGRPGAWPRKRLGPGGPQARSALL